MSVSRHQVGDFLEVLSALSRTIRAHTARSREPGSSGTSLGVLTALSQADARPGDLAALLHVGPSVISRAVTPLEQAGLIARTSDPADARACLLTLTDLGRSRLRIVTDDLLDRLAIILGDWSDRDVDAAGRLLHSLDEGLTRSSPLDATHRLLPPPSPTDAPASLTTENYQEAHS